MGTFRKTVLVVATAGWLCAPAYAQDVSRDGFDTAPPHVAVVEGVVVLDREDVTEPAAQGVPLVSGDRVRTERGRAEILFADGTALDLDEYSEVELQDVDLLSVTRGRVLLAVTGANNPQAAVRFTLDTPVASAQTFGPGEYRVTIFDGASGIQTELAVARGSASLITDRGSMPLRAGERSIAWDNGSPSSPQYFNSARYDEFDRWASLRRTERVASISAQYLPADLRYYGGSLDRYGSWEHESGYGYVWYPSVATDWRPYYDGYWSSVPTYGWTWVGLEVWSWPTHHYGRWGHVRNRWFWIPDRRWGPAWVSWGGAPGYVSWCPLDYRNRPVFSLSVSVGNDRRWNGWTVVSRDHFGRRERARQFAVEPRSFPRNTPFIEHAAAPAAPPRAVPRRVAGRPQDANADRRSGGLAVPRNGGAPIGSPRSDRGSIVTAPRSTDDSARGGRAAGRARDDNGSIAAPAPVQPGIGVDRRDRGASRAPGREPARPNSAPSGGSIYTDRNRNSAATAPQSPAAPITPSAPASPNRPEYGNAARRSPGQAPAAARPGDVNDSARRSRSRGPASAPPPSSPQSSAAPAGAAPVAPQGRPAPPAPDRPAEARRERRPQAMSAPPPESRPQSQPQAQPQTAPQSSREERRAAPRSGPRSGESQGAPAQREESRGSRRPR